MTGPDEYSVLEDNNAYTSLMARDNMRFAAATAERHPDGAERLEVSRDEIVAWRRAAAAMTLPIDERLAVHQQSEGWTERERRYFTATPPEA